MIRAAIGVFCIAVSVWPQTADQQPAPKGSIEGQVVNLRTGEPIRKANLTLQRTDVRQGAPYSTTTDAAGHFILKELEAGKYRLSVERNGFVRADYGARAPGRPGMILTLAAGQRMTDLAFKLVPHGVITGRVMDPDGEPLANANIQALTYRYAGGRKQLMPAGFANTNDLGEYRIFGLAPAKYILSASYRNASVVEVPAPGNPAAKQEEGYAPTYYPGSTDTAGAAPLEITPGSELRGVDLTLRRVRTVRIRGRLIAPEGNRRGGMVTLIPRDMSGGFNNRHNAPVRDPDGHFELRGITTGAYLLMADWFDGKRRYSARLPVDAGASDVENIVLTMMPAFEMKGQFRVEGHQEGTQPLAFQSMRLFLQPRDAVMRGGGGGGGGEVKPDGTFTVQNLAPDVYTASIAGLTGNFYVKTIRIGDQESSDGAVDLSRGVGGALDILLSAAGGTIEGAVIDEQQKPAGGVTVTLIPDARQRNAQQLYKTATTDQNGHYSIKGITPGEYKLYAWDAIEPGAYQDPDFIQPFENKGEARTVRENGNDSVPLKLLTTGDK